jgi:hypothetical protein
VFDLVDHQEITSGEYLIGHRPDRGGVQAEEAGGGGGRSFDDVGRHLELTQHRIGLRQLEGIRPKEMIGPGGDHDLVFAVLCHHDQGDPGRSAIHHREEIQIDAFGPQQPQGLLGGRIVPDTRQ